MSPICATTSIKWSSYVSTMATSICRCTRAWQPDSSELSRTAPGTRFVSTAGSTGSPMSVPSPMPEQSMPVMANAVRAPSKRSPAETSQRSCRQRATRAQTPRHCPFRTSGRPSPTGLTVRHPEEARGRLIPCAVDDGPYSASTSSKKTVGAKQTSNVATAAEATVGSGRPPSPTRTRPETSRAEPVQKPRSRARCTGADVRVHRVRSPHHRPIRVRRLRE